MLRTAMADDTPDDPGLDDHLSALLAWRLRTRGIPEARAIVDHCLALVARASVTDDPAVQAGLTRDVEQLADSLALQFGPPKVAALH